MTKKDEPKARQISDSLAHFSQNIEELPGIENDLMRYTLACQIVDSVKRVEYIKVISSRNSSPADVNSSAFDPLKLAVTFKNNDQIDEAIWLIFLAIHFGKHKKKNWALARTLYGGINGSKVWTWENVSRNLPEFLEWYNSNLAYLQMAGSFSNHRSRESLKRTDTYSRYIRWVLEQENHLQKFDYLTTNSSIRPEKKFEIIYNSMDIIPRFGRLARFDYLCMIGKMGIYDVTPGKIYIAESTGPKKGARVLMKDEKKVIKNKEYEAILEKLDNFLGYDFGMQILEDALCNWQKSPTVYKQFIG
ncbi:alpha-glutamyl/putrescinyl thymine pyrophosphorylase clade 3 protein [Jiulongibacter sediminis]|uniref:alpha-glutamyl/putrescinyl thymine pyrophosphorylase clade 3 protein n=1 Tax=Jiulongibacter sediminis TaxID=1605367 RepID=UPI0006DCC8CD|nr:hypothetical protein [Jiulongibacter sediminis]